MLKAVLIDSSAIARGLLNTVLIDGGYDVVGQAHTCLAGNVLLIKHQPQIICVARDCIEADEPSMLAMRKDWPKAMIFMVSAEFDQAPIQKAHTRGINGYIEKPFNGGTVLKTIRNTIIAAVKRQQKAQADAQGADPAGGSDEV